MKLNELRPCDCCRGPLRVQGIGSFYVVRTSIAIWNARAINQTLGLAQALGGGDAGLTLAHAMGPNPDVAMIAGDEEPSMMTEILICFNCWIKPISLAELSEVINKRPKTENSA